MAGEMKVVVAEPAPQQTWIVPIRREGQQGLPLDVTFNVLDIKLADGTTLSLTNCSGADPQEHTLEIYTAVERQPLRDAIFEWGAQHGVALNEDQINGLLQTLHVWLKPLDPEWDL